MALPNQSRAKRSRLWLIFTIGLAISLLGALILFNPTLEFAAVDLIEKLGLPIGLTGNIALIGDAALFAISTLGLIALGLHLLFRKPYKT